MSWIGLQCVVVLFPGHSHLLFSSSEKNEHAISIKLCHSVEYDRITDVLKRPMALARMSQMHVTDPRQQ